MWQGGRVQVRDAHARISFEFRPNRAAFTAPLVRQQAILGAMCCGVLELPRRILASNGDFGSPAQNPEHFILGRRQLLLFQRLRQSPGQNVGGAQQLQKRRFFTAASLLVLPPAITKYTFQRLLAPTNACRSRS
jgi:hypothetical protein